MGRRKQDYLHWRIRIVNEAGKPDKQRMAGGTAKTGGKDTFPFMRQNKQFEGMCNITLDG